MVTFAECGPLASTSIWRGFKKGVLAIKFLSQYPRPVTPIRLPGRHKKGRCDDDQIAVLKRPGRLDPVSSQLAGVQLDDQTLVDIGRDLVTLGQLLEDAFELGRIDGDPAGQTALFGE